MLASPTPGPYEFHRRQPGSPWLSASVSVAITAGLFAAALLSMKAAPAWLERRDVDVAPSTMIRLSPPAAVPAPPKEVPRITARVRPAAPAPAAAAGDPTVAPTSIPAGVPVPAARATDSTAGSAQSPSTPTTASAPSPRADVTGGSSPAAAARGAAPVAPAGVTGLKSKPLTASEMASVRQSMMASIPELARSYVPTPQEAADLQLDKRRAEQIVRRVSTAGNARDVHIATGDAVGGAGVAGGGLSSGSLTAGRLPVAILEPGPSPAQRKRNETIDADNRARFARLEARLVAKRDSVRADSLRRDSLARKPIVP